MQLRLSLPWSYVVWLALVIEIERLSIASAYAALPLGQLTLNGSVSSDCPSGFSCTGFTVAAPGVTNDAPGYFAVARYTTAIPRGLALFFTGGSGESWWTDQDSALPAFAQNLRNDGFTVGQVKWATDWLQSSPVNQAGQALLAARPATVIKYVHDNYYLPMHVPAHPVGQAGFVITGNSGGSSQVGYSLSHYGLDSILDVVIPTGGPPHSDIARSVLETDSTKPWYFPLSTRQYIDRGWGFFDGNGPAARQDPSFKSNWDSASVAIGGNDYYHPTTRIHFIWGSEDLGMQDLGGEYYDRLVAAGSPMVSYEIAANTPHAVYSTPEGRTAIWNAITETLPAIPGDFNGNGVVDAADYVTWRKGLGTTYTQSDYDVWRAHFGQTAGSGAGAIANAAVPEPTTLVMLILAALGASTQRSSCIKRVSELVAGATPQ
jgi:hypothetical protein